MKKVDFVIAKTDQTWFDNLKMKDSREVVFWTPSVWKICEQLSEKPWYFVKKGSVPALMGVGKFKTYSVLNISDAWKKYSHTLGADSLNELLRIMRKASGSECVGCVELYDVEYWEESDYLLYPDGKYLQKFKYCDASKLGVIGYSSVLNMLDDFKLIKSSKKQQKCVNRVLRLGQASFKKLLMKEYNCCCVTGETQKELLEAAHIQPYISEKSHHIQNGLLLRCDIHKLFDAGLLMIDEDYRVRLSSKITSQNYVCFDKRKIYLPLSQRSYPSLEALREKMKICMRYMTKYPR